MTNETTRKQDIAFGLLFSAVVLATATVVTLTLNYHLATDYSFTSYVITLGGFTLGMTLIIVTLGEGYKYIKYNEGWLQ